MKEKPDPPLVRRSLIAIEKRLDDVVLAVSEITRHLRRELPPKLASFDFERVLIEGKPYLVVLTLHCGRKPPMKVRVCR